jgi:hypothetical protein
MELKQSQWTYKAILETGNDHFFNILGFFHQEYLKLVP